MVRIRGLIRVMRAVIQIVRIDKVALIRSKDRCKEVVRGSCMGVRRETSESKVRSRRVEEVVVQAKGLGLIESRGRLRRVSVRASIY